MKIENTEQLLSAEISNLLDIETQLIQALSQMASKASDPELKETFEEHLEETKGQLERLNEANDLLGVEGSSLPSQSMKGMIEDGIKMTSMTEDPEIRDMALIASAIKIEHFEIACYTSAITLAQSLGNEEVEDLLSQNIEEEIETERFYCI